MFEGTVTLETYRLSIKLVNNLVLETVADVGRDADGDLLDRSGALAICSRVNFNLKHTSKLILQALGTAIL